MLNTSELINQINKSDVVSFDIFDTLIVRSFVKPRDVLFYHALKSCKKYNIPLHPERFLKLRMSCEREARENSGKEDIDLKEIYELFGKNLFLNESIICSLMEDEVCAELKFCQPRVGMKDVYDYALKSGKKIYYVSDMYLTKNVIERILKNNGYLVSPENIIVSSEFGKTKHTGKLFEVLKDKSKKEAKSLNILHIGDNFNADIKKAREHGIKAYYSENVKEEFLKNSELNKIYSDYLTGRLSNLGVNLMLGLCADRFMGSVHPRYFYKRSSLFDGRSYNLGYLGLGFFIFNFTAWLLDFSKKNKIENLYFLARDGYLLYEAFKIISENVDDAPKAHYLLASRRMYSVPAIFDKKDLNLIFNNSFTGTVSDFIQYRLGLSESDEINKKIKKIGLKFDSEISTFDNKNIIRDIVNLISDEIIENSKLERDALAYYLAEQGCLSGKNAFVDLGYNGSICTYFNKIFNADILAINLLTDSASKERTQYPNGLSMVSWMFDEIPFTSYKFNTSKIIPLLETIFSTEQNQAVKFIRNSKNEIHPVYLEDPKSNDIKRKEFVSEVHAGVIDFINDFHNISKEDVDLYRADPVVSSYILDRHFNNPSVDDVNIWDGIYFENNFAGWKDKAIFSSSGKYVSLWGSAFSVDSNVKSSGKSVDRVFEPKESSFIEKIAFLKLTTKKFNKFQRSKIQFFNDARNPFVRTLGVMLAKRNII